MRNQPQAQPDRASRQAPARPPPSDQMPDKKPLTLTPTGVASASPESDPDDSPLLQGAAEASEGPTRPWKLLIVDDEPEVHSITRLALSDFRYRRRGLEFISAFNGGDAQQIIENDPEIAVILLDVVMETEDAGLKVIQYIRQTLGNRFVRIVLRTGHPGLAPERRVIEAYDINDYRAKTDLTQDRMFSLIHTSLTAYEHLTSLARSRRQLASVAEEYKALLERVAARVGAPAGLVSQAAASLRPALEPHTPPELRDQWDHLDDGSQRITELAHGLERLSRLAHAESAPAEFDGDAAMQEVLQNCADMIQRSGAQVNLAQFPTLYGHRVLFQQLMEELLRNALQFHDHRPPQVDISIQARGQNWSIAVADRGRGIPADRLEDIFQAFVSSPSASPTQSEGLGLVICRKIAALHGGKLWAEARSGGGSRLILLLPARGG